MKIRVLIIILLLIATGLAVGFFVYLNPFTQEEPSIEEVVVEEPVVPDREVLVDIVDGSTYGILMEESGVTTTIANDIFEAASKVYDLSSIRVGRQLKLVYDIDTNEFKRFYYQIDSEEELFVDKTNDGWQAKRQDIPYEVRVKTSTGSIETSMYQSALDQGIDERAIVELANIFQWTIDFAYQVQAGDTYSFIFEERYLNGEYVMPGRILAGKFTNEKTPYYVFFFSESEDNETYFDENGNSVQKIFLKAPVAFKYISSGFTTGSRYVQAFNISTGHRAIDYAAAYGTPIRSVGDGTVVKAGWNGPYGNFVSVRHNSTYTTNYGHMSKIGVKYGTPVKQGDIIGYVGSTGFSTGPHVHYEMVKNGIKINPLREILPPGEPIKEENKERFNSEISTLRTKLDGIQ